MTHEPGCPDSVQRLYWAERCPICYALRAAYQRGREDATRAIAELVHDTIVSKKLIDKGLPDFLTEIYYAGGGKQT